jgi:hypothetical protein
MKSVCTARVRRATWSTSRAHSAPKANPLGMAARSVAAITVLAKNFRPKTLPRELLLFCRSMPVRSPAAHSDGM